jgi:hypothetical protein
MEGRLPATEFLLDPTDLVSGGVPLLLRMSKTAKLLQQLSGLVPRDGCLPSA